VGESGLSACVLPHVAIVNLWLAQAAATALVHFKGNVLRIGEHGHGGHPPAPRGLQAAWQGRPTVHAERSLALPPVDTHFVEGKKEEKADDDAKDQSSRGSV